MQEEYMRSFKRLFNRDDYSEYQYLNNYLDLYYEILDGDPITSHPELNKYQRNMKLLLRYLDLQRNLYDRGCNNHYLEFIDQVAYLGKALGSIRISEVLVDRLIRFCGNPEDKKILDVTESIYLPKKVDDYRRYINNCNWFYNEYLHSRDILHNKCTYGNKSIDGFLKYILDKYNNLIDNKILFEEELMISLIFAYLHYNKLDNYELIDRYINNVSYFEDKMILNNCLHYLKGRKKDGSFNYPNAKMLLKDMDSFLTIDKGIK